jgi:hypothetical protein
MTRTKGAKDLKPRKRGATKVKMNLYVTEEAAEHIKEQPHQSNYVSQLVIDDKHKKERCDQK